jgi:hypothetical protein
MRYIKNLRDREAHKVENPKTLIKSKPKFANKAEFRDWCSDANTNHAFVSMCEGDAPGERVTNANPVNKTYGFIADFDAPVDWDLIEIQINDATEYPPKWVCKTHSGYARALWEFDEPLPIDKTLYENFVKEIAKSVKAQRLLAGFDDCAFKANQYFEVGEEWQEIGRELPSSVVHAALNRAIQKRQPTTNDVTVPMSVIAEQVESVFPGRWLGDFEVGARGPLFWVNDGIDRDGCQVAEDGMICYSDRAGKGFVPWGEIFGSGFIKKYEEKKIATVMDDYWFNGKNHFKLLHGCAVTIPKDQLVLELRQKGFSPKPKKNQQISEVDSAVLMINNQNRVDEIAPVVFSNDRVVTYNGCRILNNASNKAVQPAEDGDPKNWPFLYKWLNQLFSPAGDRPATDYFFSWLKRFYEAALYYKFQQGQALLLVGMTNKGKSLLSNRVIGTLVGGFADASDYLSGHTKFNKDLGRAAAWVIDDTVSAASFEDQRKATELIKRAVANPRIEYQAKYVDTISIPWTGRVIMSLNMDANSLTVIPALDSSNRDKIMALRISDFATSDFPASYELEQTIEMELPHFARFLLDWQVPSELNDFSRFGVDSFIDESIVSAAYDNSSRSAIAELVEFFVEKYRGAENLDDEGTWRGTLTNFQVLVHEFNNGRSVGMSQNLEFVRRGFCAMEEAHKANPRLRPIKSSGHGGGKKWTIDLSPKYDIDNYLSFEETETGNPF